MLNTWKSSLIKSSRTVPAIIFPEAPQALITAYHNTHHFVVVCKYVSAVVFYQAILFMDSAMYCSSYFPTPPKPCTQNHR